MVLGFAGYAQNIGVRCGTQIEKIGPGICVFSADASVVRGRKRDGRGGEHASVFGRARFSAKAVRKAGNSHKVGSGLVTYLPG